MPRHLTHQLIDAEALNREPRGAHVRRCLPRPGPSAESPRPARRLSSHGEKKRSCTQKDRIQIALNGCSLVQGHWKPYFTVPGVQHALCNAHHLRELEALTEIDGEAWARHMQRSLRMADQAAGIAREESFVLPPGLVAWSEQRYDRLVAEASEYHEGLELLRPARTARIMYPEHYPALLFRDFDTETLGSLQATAWKPGRNRIETPMQWPAVMLADLRD